MTIPKGAPIGYRRQKR